MSEGQHKKKKSKKSSKPKKRHDSKIADMTVGQEPWQYCTNPDNSSSGLEVSLTEGNPQSEDDDEVFEEEFDSVGDELGNNLVIVTKPPQESSPVRRKVHAQPLRSHDLALENRNPPERRPGVKSEKDDPVVREKISYAPSAPSTQPGAVAATNDSAVRGKLTHAAPSVPPTRPGAFTEKNDSVVKEKMLYARPGALGATRPGAVSETNDSAVKGKLSHVGPSVPGIRPGAVAETNDSAVRGKVAHAGPSAPGIRPGAVAETNDSAVRGKVAHAGPSSPSSRPGATAEANDSTVRGKIEHADPSAPISRPGAVAELNDSAVRGKVAHAGPSAPSSRPGATAERNDSVMKGKLARTAPSESSSRPGATAETNDSAVKDKVSHRVSHAAPLPPSIRPGAISETNDSAARSKSSVPSSGRPGATAETNDTQATEKAGDRGPSVTRLGRMHSTRSEADDSAPNGTITTDRPRRRGRPGATAELDDAAVQRKLDQEFEEETVTVPLQTPFMSRSFDILPGVFATAQPSNVVMDDANASVLNSITNHSTLLMRNGSLDDQSVATSHSMLTANVRNTFAVRLFNGSTQRDSVASTNSGDSLGTADQHSRRKSTTSRPSTSRPMRMLMDDQGHTMSTAELRQIWEATGKCIECGTVQTHKKEKFGPFGVLRRMEAQTEEGRSYKGYCLRCFDVHALRRIFNDPDIPLDLIRHDFLNSSLTSLGAIDEVMCHPERKRGPFATMCGSTRFQICFGLFLVALAGALVALGITLSKGAAPLLPPEPTAAPSASPSTPAPSSPPTSYEWNIVAEIVEDNVPSFGYSVALSSDGTILVASAPAYDGSRGRVSVYRMLGNAASQKWLLAGDPLQGSAPGEKYGTGMAISEDGTTVAMGAPGYLEGLVEVYSILPDGGLTQKGQTIIGPAAYSEFGFAIALSGDGNRLFVGAPQYGVGNAVYGLVAVYDFNGSQWVQVGNDMTSKNVDSRFGSSLAVSSDGGLVAVGAPLDDEKWRDAGQIFVYALQGGEWVIFTTNLLTGPEEGSMLGTQVEINAIGKVVLTGSSDSEVEEFSDAGVVSAYGIDDTFLDFNLVGVPISGTKPRAGFGNDLDISDSGELIIVGGTNGNGIAGSVRVFFMYLGQYVAYGNELFGPALGNGVWASKGPSVAMASSSLRVAIGYESIMSENGKSHSIIQVFDYFAVNNWKDQASV